MSDEDERDVVEMALDDLLAAMQQTARGHDIPELMASYHRFGYTTPPEIDERTGGLVAGHGRVTALAELWQTMRPPPEGIEIRDGRWMVPTYRGWASENDEEALAYMIASNRIGENHWQADVLLSELNKLSDFTGIGFKEMDVDDMLARLDASTAEIERREIERDDEHSWPVIRFRVPSELRERYQLLIRDWPERTAAHPDDAVFAKLLDLAER